MQSAQNEGCSILPWSRSEMQQEASCSDSGASCRPRELSPRLTSAEYELRSSQSERRVWFTCCHPSLISFALGLRCSGLRALSRKNLPRVDMHRASLTAMGIVRIFDALERNVSVKIRLASRRLERQIVIASPLDIVQNEASFFFAWMNTSSRLCMPSV